jgi:membrane fusion protein (multidrug efflux system)
MTTRRKLWLATILGLVAIVGSLAAIKATQIRAMIRAGKTQVPPPESVTTAEVKRESWEQARAAIGTIVAVRGVTLGAEVTGTVTEIAFDSGGFVREGDLLVKLDTSVEEAQLAAAQAEAALAKVSLERAQTLRQGGSNTPADLDAARATSKQAGASVGSLKALIAKKSIRAPFAGRIAIRQVELGQVVSPGTPVASLQSVSPIHIDFFLPQQALAKLSEGQRTRASVDIYPGERWEGEVATINPEVDPATRNVRVRATFLNPDGRLLPGMFANVDVVSRERRSVLVIPGTAVLYAPYGDSVFVLEEKADEAGRSVLFARQRLVRLGERRGDFVAVARGLDAGETVVSSGAFKLRSGAPVAVNNAHSLRPELSPKPVDE